VSITGPACLAELDQAVAVEVRRLYGCTGTDLPRLLSNWGRDVAICIY